MAAGKFSAEIIQATEPLNLDYGLSLIPRLKIRLSFTRSDISSVKPINEWQLKLSLTNYLRDSLSITLSDGDLVVEKFRDLKKRKRFEPVASGVLFLWDLGFLKRELKEERRSLEERFNEWKGFVVGKMDGVELNVEGLMLKLCADVPVGDDLCKMEAIWKEFFAVKSRGYGSRNIVHPDTLIMEGVPSRWFAEPRVSSKVSVLVTHTIFSNFGKIRNLDFVGNNDLGKAVQDIGRDITSALQCKVWVQYERFDSFYNAVKAFCGRSMQKEGSRLKANYRIDWDKEGYFMEVNVRRRAYENRIQEEMKHMQPIGRPFKSESVVPKAQFPTSGIDGQNGEKAIS
ncbi:hypothetical protein KI387_008246, partial [Taxus chinensis]